jgi:hypothetical protein
VVARGELDVAVRERVELVAARDRLAQRRRALGKHADHVPLFDQAVEVAAGAGHLSQRAEQHAEERQLVDEVVDHVPHQPRRLGAAEHVDADHHRVVRQHAAVIARQHRRAVVRDVLVAGRHHAEVVLVQPVPQRVAEAEHVGVGAERVGAEARIGHRVRADLLPLARGQERADEIDLVLGQQHGRGPGSVSGQ